MQTDQPYSGSASSLKANTLAQPIPTNAAFNLQLLNPYPSSFDFGADGGLKQNVTYDGKTPVTVNSSIDDKSVIRGNVFADNKPGHPGIRRVLRQAALMTIALCAIQPSLLLDLRARLCGDHILACFGPSSEGVAERG